MISAHEVRTEVGEVTVGTEECFEHLIEGLDDPDPKVRRFAVCGLAAVGDPLAVGVLIPRLFDADPEIRVRAAMALGKIGDPSAAPALIEAADLADPSLHRAAILALGELGPVGVDVLACTLRDGNTTDRERAVIALGETRDVAAVLPLTDALLDEDETVRVRAREALEKIRESPVF